MMKTTLFAFLCCCFFTGLQAQNNGAVCGSMFNDLNGNGVYDSGEPGVPGILIVVAAAPTVEDLEPQVTDAEGGFCFTGLSIGVYTFMIEVPPGWQLTGDNNTFTVTITDDTTVNGYRYGVSSTAFVEDVSKEVLRIYPNPAGSEFNLQLGGITQNCELAIFDFSGRQVLWQSIADTNTRVSTANLPSGMYVAQVKAAAGIQHVKLMIVK